MKHLLAEEAILEALQNKSYLPEALKMLFSLFFLLLIAYFTLRFMRKLMQKKSFFLNQSGGIKIMERRALNPKASLYIVEVQGKTLLVSESSAGVHLLTELEKREMVEEPAPSRMGGIKGFFSKEMR